MPYPFAIPPQALSCKTKYPIVLLHGTGSRDHKQRGCWGRIPKALENYGAEVYFGNQDAWGTIENNAIVVKENINAVLSETNCGKVNIIAISKGGLEARYMIFKLGMGDKVASLTTISTPHYGSKTMDFLCKRLKYPMKLAAVFVNQVYRYLGDESPDFYGTCNQFTTAHIKRFNHEILDSNKIYYQSYASLMKKPYSDILLFFPHLVVKWFDGECDGIVSVDSAKWGEFKGVITGEGIRGISHSDLRDLRKRDGSGTDIRGVFVRIVRELKEKGL